MGIFTFYLCSLLRHLVILFNAHAKPEASWGGKAKELGEELILTVGAQHVSVLSPTF